MTIPTTVDPDLQDRLSKLRRLRQLRSAYGLYAYRPHSKQSLFHAAGNHKRRYLRTGNRFGKSTCGAAEDVAFAIGARLWLDESDPVRSLGIPSRSTKGLILVADWDKASEVFTNREEGQAQGKLFKLIPKDRIGHVHKNQAGEISMIEVKNIFGGVSTIYLDTVKSYMSNPLGQESSQWDWIHVDEPIPKKMWEANARGLIDTHGSAWFTCTPISEQWINEEFLPVKLMKNSFEQGFVWEKGDLKKDSRPWTLTGSSYDNTTVSKEGIDDFCSSLDTATRQSRIYGLPKSSQGLVYPEFDQDRHVYTDLPIGWKDFDQPPANYTIRVFIDTHPRTPHAVHFWATAPTGQAFLYNEIFSTFDGLISGLCGGIIETLGTRVPHGIFIEPAAFTPNPTDGRCFADVFLEHNLEVEPAPKELRSGITKAKQALNQPGFIYVNSCCTRTLKEFYTYVWDKDKEKPVDKDDHMMECFYRACTIGLEWADPQDAKYDQRVLRYSNETCDLTSFSGGNLSRIAA